MIATCLELFDLDAKVHRGRRLWWSVQMHPGPLGWGQLEA